MQRPSLVRFAWLSIAAAIVTISLKMGAYFVTGSVGILSDGLESLVNLVAAVVALAMLTIAARPPDEDHAYGHDKAEYFSSGVEGVLILLAAASIAVTSVPRLSAPQPIVDAPLGLAVSFVASAINFGVARILLRAGHQHHSITLEADAHHLITDVWTSAGVIIGIVAVVVTGWQILDPIIALVVAANIIWSGVKLVQRSALGLLDTALPASELAKVHQVLDMYAIEGIQFHALLTRQAGVRRFVSVHVLVPGSWTVQTGHAFVERIESHIRRELPNTNVITHLEPVEDPASWKDTSLDREEEAEEQVEHS